jgi:hypothetical protein
MLIQPMELVFAGDQALQNSLHIAWDTLATRWSRGSDSGIRNPRLAVVCSRRQEMRGSRL